MKTNVKYLFLIYLLNLAAVTQTIAQWKTEEFPLVAGWNAIFLHVDATHEVPDNIFSTFTDIEEVWRWNPQLTSTQFINNPSAPNTTLQEWNVWIRGFPAQSDLTMMLGNHAYLIKVADLASPLTLQIKGKPAVPDHVWKKSGLNLFGFPTPPGNNTVPSYNNYFDPVPFLKQSSQVFKYVGGALIAGANPVQVFNPNVEIIERGRAYWIDSSNFSTYYGPVKIETSNISGLTFSAAGSTQSVALTNLGDDTVTVTLTPGNSEAAPTGEASVAGIVPLLVREFDAGQTAFVYNPFGSQQQITLEGGETKEVVIAIDRNTMGGNTGDIFQSLLTVTDSNQFMEVYLPVSVEVASHRGLWVGEALVDQVQNQLQRPSRDTNDDYLRNQGTGEILFDSEDTQLHPTAQTFPLRLILHMDQSDTTHLPFRYLSWTNK